MGAPSDVADALAVEELETDDRADRRGRRRATLVRRRPRRRWLVPSLVVMMVFGVLFAAAAIQIRLIAGQRNLDVLQARIADAQVEQDDLRQQEAMLRSPAKVTQIAANDLGMVPAAPPQMVPPAPRYIGAPHPQVPPTTVAPATSLPPASIAPGTP